MWLSKNEAEAFMESLTKEDYEALFIAIKNPSPPNEELKNAFEKYYAKLESEENEIV